MTHARTRKISRNFLVLAALSGLVGGVAVPAFLAPSAAAASSTDGVFGTLSGATKKLVPGNGVLVGAAVAPRGSERDRVEATANFEKKLGSPLDLHRVYSTWTDPQPGKLVRDDVAKGRVPAVSIFPTVTWRQIANGSQDKLIREHARGYKALNAPIMMTLHHEPEDDPQAGTPADFVAAWKRYVNLYRAEGASNVSFAWVLMAYSFGTPGKSVADAYYPGDDFVDWIGSDGYNWYGCQGNAKWRSFEDTFASFAAWAAPHRKPLYIAEFGSTEGAPGQKAKWLDDATVAMRRMPQLKAIAYFNTGYDCDWWLDSSSDLGAFKRLTAGLSPRLQPASVPTAAEVGVKDVTARKATVQGYVTPGNTSVSVSVKITANGSTQTKSAGTLPAGSSSHPVTVPLTGLKPGTAYRVQLVAVGGGRTTTATATLNTRAAATAAVGAPSMVEYRQFTVPVRANTAGVAGTVRLEYGTTSSLGRRHAKVMKASGAAAGSFWISGLAPNTTYYVRATVTTADGVVRSPLRTVRTKIAYPKIVSSTAYTGWGKARVSGKVDLSKAAGKAWVQYGKTKKYGSATRAVSIRAGQAWAAVPVTKLAHKTTYHVRLVVKTSRGTAFGPDRVVRVR